MFSSINIHISCVFLQVLKFVGRCWFTKSTKTKPLENNHFNSYYTESSRCIIGNRFVPNYAQCFINDHSNAVIILHYVRCKRTALANQHACSMMFWVGLRCYKLADWPMLALSVAEYVWAFMHSLSYSFIKLIKLRLNKNRHELSNKIIIKVS